MDWGLDCMKKRKMAKNEHSLFSDSWPWMALDQMLQAPTTVTSLSGWILFLNHELK